MLNTLDWIDADSLAKAHLKCKRILEHFENIRQKWERIVDSCEYDCSR